MLPGADVVVTVAVQVGDDRRCDRSPGLSGRERPEMRRPAQRAVAVVGAHPTVGARRDDLGNPVAGQIAERGRRHRRSAGRDRPTRHRGAVVDVPREHLVPVGAVVEVAAADDDLGPAVAVDVADRGARPHRVVELVLPDLSAVRARAVVAGRPFDGAELAARPVDRAAGRLVAADEDVEAAVTVDVVQRGRRPRRVLDVVDHDLVAVAVDRVDVEVEAPEHDVGVAVAVDVADRGRRVHAVGVAVRVPVAVQMLK